jgi:hypothetical protein
LRKFKTPTKNIALVKHEGDLLVYSNGYGHVMFGTTVDDSEVPVTCYNLLYEALRYIKEIESVRIPKCSGEVPEALRYQSHFHRQLQLILENYLF